MLNVIVLAVLEATLIVAIIMFAEWAWAQESPPQPTVQAYGPGAARFWAKWKYVFENELEAVI